MRPLSGLVSLAPLVAAQAVAGCGSATAPPVTDVPTVVSDAGPACAAGMVSACSCPGGGQGARLCLAIGSFGPCGCTAGGPDGGGFDVVGDVSQSSDAGTDAAPTADLAPVSDTGATVPPTDTGPGCASMMVGNCGGVACTTPAHATAAACVACECGVGTCVAGFADCDGVGANGCEVDTTSDVMNCGACGAPCDAGQRCLRAACVP